MANVTLFDTATGTYIKVTINLNPALLSHLAHKGMTVTQSSPVR